MARHSQAAGSDTPSFARRAIQLSLAAAAGVAAAYLIAEIVKRRSGERVAVGSAYSPFSVENALRKAAEAMQRGSQSLIDNLDQAKPGR